jgi:60S ribosomal protein uL30
MGFVILQRVGSQQKMERRKRMAERRSSVDVPKGSIQQSVGLVVRIHAGRHASDEIKETLRKWGLNKKYDAVFMKLDASAISKLKAYDAYVAYGYISLSSVEELLHRRAYTSAISGVRQTLSDNTTIEALMGEKYNILCVSDLVNEIYNIGENFEPSIKFLCTFKLASPVGGYEKDVLKIYDKVEEKGGFLGADMESFLKKLI